MPRGGEPRVLVVEDDDAVREAVAAALRGAGYQVRDERDGLGLDGVVRSFRPDLAVLDVRLPAGPSGLSIARRLRSDADIPTLFLTAADSVEDRLAGFEAGGDDYLAKPFAVAELLARVKALLRRSGALSSASWQVGDLVVDEESRAAVRGDRHLELTRREFDLLVALGAKPGRVLTKIQLLSTVWGFEEYDPNLVEVHISSLRRKLEAEGEPRLIQTVRGIGYVLRAT
ncbi:MAG: response regulator transcription factor [Actinomycetota bacterium]|nr:response regulator transcription factor [Actinomycetota bacterium]